MIKPTAEQELLAADLHLTWCTGPCDHQFTKGYYTVFDLHEAVAREATR